MWICAVAGLGDDFVFLLNSFPKLYIPFIHTNPQRTSDSPTASTSLDESIGAAQEVTMLPFNTAQSLNQDPPSA
jgi:hypothetical protein